MFQPKCMEGNMPTTPTATQDEAEIRARLTAWAKALHAKDLNALMALYAPDVNTFDLMPPIRSPTPLRL